jgi:hypothetical protein
LIAEINVAIPIKSHFLSALKALGFAVVRREAGG